jgi:hypothetical protein
MFYNLKTARCDPQMRHLAMMAGLGEDEGATRMARTAVQMGEDAGWIKRLFRYGGSRRSQSSEFILLFPAAVTEAWKIELEAVERDGLWYAAQVTDGVEVCGPFRARTGAETWIKDHGPEASRPDSTVRSAPTPTGQIRDPDRTNSASRPDSTVRLEKLKRKRKSSKGR